MLKLTIKYRDFVISVGASAVNLLAFDIGVGRLSKSLRLNRDNWPNHRNLIWMFRGET